MTEEQHGESGHHGFILGILIGILIALLFTTQKGRRLLKIISHEGAQRFGSIDDMLAVLMRELGEDAEIVEDSVMGEGSTEDVKKIEKVEKSLGENEANQSEPEKIEKIDTQHLEKEIAEIKEEIKEDKIEKIDTAHVDEEKVAEQPQKKTRRLFKGIRRKT